LNHFYVPMDRNSLNAADVRCGPEQSIAKVMGSSRHQRCSQKRSAPTGSHIWRLGVLSQLACRCNTCATDRDAAIQTIFRLVLLYIIRARWCWRVGKREACIMAWPSTVLKRFSRSTICAAKGSLNSSHTREATRQSTERSENNLESATVMFATFIAAGGAC
jgi:hypothetical protein